MAQTRNIALVLVVMLVCSGVAGVSLAAVPDNRVTITDTTVSPGTPTAGAPTTVSATVRLSGGSSSAATLDRVAILDDGETLGEATGLGSLSPGETLTVPVTVRFADLGTRNLTVVATVTDNDGETTTARRPLSLAVESGAPQIEVEADSLVAGADASASVTVSNPTTAPLRDVTVSFVDIDGERTTRTVATLAAGASQPLNFSLRAGTAGTQALQVEVTYTTAAGTRATSTGERAVEVEPLDDDVGIRVERTTLEDGATGAADGGLAGLAGALGGGGGGGGGVLQSAGGDGSDDEQRPGSGVTVTNFGNAPINELVLIPRLANGSIAPGLGRVAVADTLAPGEEMRVTVDLSAVRATSLRFAIAYELGGEAREAVQPYPLDRKRGAVSLTGLNLSLSGDSLKLSGNLGNVGDGEVRGVVVSVGRSEYAQPAYPQRNYFLGTIGASEFAPFELTATIDTANATTVPVEVAYTTAGERRVETLQLPLPPESDRVGGNRLFGDLGGPLVVVTLGLLVSVPLLGFALRRYR
ncbi:CARDB domain-containing protein [Halolamina sp.]|jgi:hypothetical protein|uniref:CARDB domain-containing protein n=1 Tax=Halolamina sp. TaxID=1940283 RepID=UPI000223BDD9|nr:hypothetical protein Halar_2611 [halophilic archaeon DL31]